MNSPAISKTTNEIVNAVIREDVRDISSYHVPNAAGLVKLDAMENPYSLPPALQEKLAQRLSAVALNRYPQPAYEGLKGALAHAFEVPHGAQVILGNGSDELISMLIAATAPGVVLSPWPSFVMYKLSSQYAHSPFIGVDLRADDFGLDEQAMLAAIKQHQPKLVFIAVPNNPTGNSFDEGAIKNIIAACPGLVVIDEAYRPFANTTWMSQVLLYPNVLVMRTVSKLGLAGLRLGYMAGSPEWINQLEKVRPPYNINVLTEAAALFALEHREVLDQQADSLRNDRARLIARLRTIQDVQVFESQANFVLVRVPDAAARFASMKAQGVLIKDVSKMHPILANCLRLTVGSPQENQHMLAALQAG
jgi:histidinol-phosphate aminotransferase